MLPSTTATDSPSRRFRRGSKRSSASVRVMPLSISRVLEHRSCCTFPSKQWFPLLQGMKGAYHTAQVSAAAVHVCVYAYVYVKILVADLYIYIYLFIIHYSLFIYLSFSLLYNVQRIGEFAMNPLGFLPKISNMEKSWRP